MISAKSDFFHSASTLFVILTCLVIPFATSLVSLFSILAIGCWLFSGKIRNFKSLVTSNRVILLATLLFVLFVIGISYSVANFEDSLACLKKYRELLLIPLISLILQNNPRAQKNCEYSFVAGCIILLLISYGMAFSILPPLRYGNSVVHHITHSFFMAILTFYSAHRSVDSEQYRYFWVVILLLAVINLFYIAPGRTGMLVFICLMLLFLIQRLSLLQQLIGLFLLTLLISTAFFTSDNFASRSTMAIKEVQKYQYGASRTSLGMRFDWWINSVKLIKEKPLFGHGTGSFPAVHDGMINGTKIKKTDNPHNEFLLIGVQLGITGILLFSSLFFAQVCCSYRLERNTRMLAQGVIAAMFVGCLMNSFLFDSHQGHFFAFLSAVYFSDISNCRLT